MSFSIDMINSMFMFIMVIAGFLTTAIATFTSRKISEKTQKTVESSINNYKKAFDTYGEIQEKEMKIKSTGDSNILTYTSPIKSKIEFALHEHEEIMSIHQKQALMHSRVQFYTGITMSILGFAFFVYILFLSLDNSNNIALGIKLTSSLIFEAIAVLFLKESHKSRENSKEYHDNLRESSEQQEAIKIADSIQNEEIRSIIQAQLALHMIGIKSETIDITKILDSNNKVS
ncbi:hypothetical protein CN939_21450 [Bacillus thuringiensis]|uniref:TRADD-N-associated membrane domain-containing protein n=1 Tax=Bacillus thuringiensis TaxID=1428 RepID=UPI000BFC92AC|nr:hypothetical protein [Bacillus thuringiensis]PGL61729.1 hypothetical protein CN939_21450 [Bacillus thuringiensis]